MSRLSLDQASKIIETALATGREMSLAPLTVAVLDAGGQLKALKREDGSGLLRPEIAIGKAWGCLGMGFGGREFARRAERQPSFIRSITVLAEGKVVPVPGGVLIRDASGEILGAVGISGDISEKDEVCAVAGIKAAGLYADTGEPAA